MKKIIKKIIPRSIKDYYNLYLKQYKKISYSQCGEDRIILPLIKKINKNNLLYLDIGAFHPYRFSNTAIFYKRGWRGINIEPNPEFYKIIAQKRKRDINLNIGVASKNSQLNYYFMSEPTLNTFSAESAQENSQKYGIKIIKVKKIPVKTIAEIIKEYNNGLFPPFLNIDTEGTEMEILKTINYTENYPKIICVETKEYGSGNKNNYLIKFLINNGYHVYADTSLNTILTKK